MKKRVLCFVMIVITLISMPAAFSHAASASSGTFGDGLSWNYDAGTRTLTVSGEGEIPDCTKSYSSTPWSSCLNSAKNVVVGEGITAIGDYAFYDMFYLESITLPSTLKKVGDFCFYECSTFETKKLYIPSLESWLGIDFERALTYNHTLRLFVNGQSVSNLVIPEGTTHIKKEAFACFTGFSSITLPSTLVYVGEHAFEGCQIDRVYAHSIESYLNIEFADMLSSFFYSNNMSTPWLYINNYKVNEIVIPYGTTKINDYAFLKCQLTKVVIPDTVKAIGEGAFYMCEKLVTADIPDGVTSIGAYAFYECAELEGVNIPKGLEIINDGTFTNCKKITKAIMGDNVKSIGDNAFAGCSMLKTVSISKSVTKIVRYAFSGCNAMTDVTFPEGLERIEEGAFKNCSSLTRVILPDTLTYLGKEVFENCTALKKVRLSNKLTEIYAYTFLRAKIKEMYIPAGITFIGHSIADEIKYVFYGGTAAQKNALIGTLDYDFYYALMNATWATEKSDIECKYSYSCDAICNVCGDTRDTLTHDYSKITVISPLYHGYSCSYCYLPDYDNQTPHTFDTSDCDYDRKCTECKFIRSAGQHSYKNPCSELCYFCGESRGQMNHTYSFPCDADCDICGKTREAEGHTFSDPCSEKCYYCDFERTAPHQFGNYTSNGDATTDKDGTKSRVCEFCAYIETVTDEGSRLPSVTPDPKPEPTPTPNPKPEPTPEVEIKDTSKIFSDIKAKAWYKQYVDYSVAYGIFTGTSKTTFSPSDSITRAQFVQVLANLEGVDTKNRNVTTQFTDVPAKKWFTAAVKWASENKIVNGVGGGKFDPNANVTREQMCVMLVNFAKFKGITLKTAESKAVFADDNKISKWAKAAVYTCQMADIVNGKGADAFDPQGTGTRAEACVIFTKFHKDYLK